jgi:hypothetical protein
MSLLARRAHLIIKLFGLVNDVLGGCAQSELIRLLLLRKMIRKIREKFLPVLAHPQR